MHSHRQFNKNAYLVKIIEIIDFDRFFVISRGEATYAFFGKILTGPSQKEFNSLSNDLIKTK